LTRNADAISPNDFVNSSPLKNALLTSGQPEELTTR